MIYHYTPIRMTKIFKINNTKNWLVCTTGTSLHCCHCNKLAQSGKIKNKTKLHEGQRRTTDQEFVDCECNYLEGRLEGRQQKSNADVGGKGMGLGIVFDGKIIQIRRVSMNYR